jgi:hypothetical protein
MPKWYGLQGLIIIIMHASCSCHDDDDAAAMHASCSHGGAAIWKKANDFHQQQ